MLERPYNGFEGFFKMHVSIIKCLWCGLPRPLEAHLGTSWGAILEPSWAQDGATLQVGFDIESRLLLGAILGPTWPQLGIQEAPKSVY